MDATTRDLLDRALTLPTTERAALAAALLESCDGPGDADAETAWVAEISERAARARAEGPVGVPWTALKAELLAK
ncbi:MAG: addiction module protein [Polyangiales bacterium]